MSPGKYLIPYSLSAFAEWMGIFAAQLPALAAKYGVVAAGNLPQTQANFNAKLPEKQLTDFVAEVVNGTPARSAPNDPFRELPSRSLVALETGLKKRIRKIGGSLKTQKSVFIQADGELLCIVAPDEVQLSPETTAPELKLRTVPNYALDIEFRKMGMDALRVETRQKGGNWQLAAILTTSPATINVVPLSDGDAEQIEVRGVFLEKNQIFGNYSPIYMTLIQQ